MTLYDKFTEWSRMRMVSSARDFLAAKLDAAHEDSAAFLFGYASARGWRDEAPKVEQWIEHLRQVYSIDGEINRGASSMEFVICVKWQGLNLSYYDWESLAAALDLMRTIETRDRINKK